MKKKAIVWDLVVSFNENPLFSPISFFLTFKARPCFSYARISLKRSWAKKFIRCDGITEDKMEKRKGEENSWRRSWVCIWLWQIWWTKVVCVRIRQEVISNYPPGKKGCLVAWFLCTFALVAIDCLTSSEENGNSVQNKTMVLFLHWRKSQKLTDFGRWCSITNLLVLPASPRRLSL